MVAGMCLQGGLTLITVKILLIGLFLFITGPTSTHAVANAAYATGLRPEEGEGLVAENFDDADQPETNRDGDGHA